MRISESHYSNSERLPERAETDSFNSLNPGSLQHERDRNVHIGQEDLLEKVSKSFLVRDVGHGEIASPENMKKTRNNSDRW